MPEQHTQWRRATRECRLDEWPGGDALCEDASDARVHGDKDDRDAEEHVTDRSAKRTDDHEREDQRWDRLETVDQSHDDRIERASNVGGHDAERRSEGHAGERARDTHEHRDAAAPEDP